jgi:alkylation response protein AidB-like acyl-CoA dehydrogenase
MPSFFTDNDDLQFYFAKGIDWASLVWAAEYGGRAPDAYQDVKEAVAFYRDVASLVGELAAEEIAPRAARIDREQPVLDGTEVKTSPAFEEIMDKLRGLDLHRLPVPRELGGLNAPVLLYYLTFEMLARGDVSVMTHTTFFSGIAMALLVYSLREGSTEIDTAAGRIGKTRFAKEIEELVSGQAWGSMDITEPDAGSDMAALRTVGEQGPDGQWTVSGQKIFISSGHGKYHVVIARTEKAAAGDDPFAGLAGLSLFLVKGYDDLPDGTRKRYIHIDRVEEKLGHHGSVTAALTFDRAPAQLLGKRGEGFQLMLLLMNNARVAVSFEGIGLAEAAYRQASAYAAERTSMGKPIARHEMIADYLDEMRTDLQGMRALAVHAGFHEEMAQKLGIFQRLAPNPTADERARLARLAEHRASARRATPLLKYLATEKAVEIARRNMQIHGGIGYTSELGADKLLRDALVLPIYEGTSQIQSLMAMKDTLGGIIKRPQAFVQRIAQARWRGVSARTELERRVARLQSLSLSAQQHLAARTATTKLRSLAVVPIGEWKRALTEEWDPKRDFATAMLHAERLTRILADELIAEILLEQALAFPERRELLERYLDRAEPRCRALLDQITNTGGRLLATLAGTMARKAG